MKARAPTPNEDTTAKKIVGRKRHTAVDTDCRLLMVNHHADISDSASGLKALRQRWPWLTHLFAGSAYDRGKLLDKAAFHRRGDPAHRCRTRIYGPTLAMNGRSHLRPAHPLARPRARLRSDIDVSEAMNYAALGSILLRRISHRTGPLKRPLRRM